MDAADRLKWMLLATLGWSTAACGGVSELEEPAGSGGDESSGGTNQSGGSSATGGKGSGGVTSTGGTNSGGDTSSGGATQTGGQAGVGGTPSRVACTNPQPLSTNNGETGFVGCDEGYRHRVERVVCANNLDPMAGPEFEASSDDACQVNADCEGDKSHCVLSDGNALPMKYCANGCTEDADCGAGYICDCGPLIGKCTRAFCTTDADCDPGELCATDDDPSCASSTRIACTRPDDECMTQEDCGEIQGGCAAGDMGRTCVPLAVCGRPFLVAGENRRAPVLIADRTSSDTARADDLDAVERQRVCDHFTRAGQMEHASIAAFARFSLQLLHLGAPVHLVEEATRAQLDEARHAELCFALAGEYGGVTVRPGSLSLEGALGETSLEEVLRLCVLEGCIGESTAALEVWEAAEEAQSDGLKAQLRGIAEDELRHAALAFRFVAWALQERPELRDLVFDLFVQNARAVAALPVERRETRTDTRLAKHGVLSPSTLGQVARRAQQQIITPCMNALQAQLSSEGPRRPLHAALQ